MRAVDLYPLLTRFRRGRRPDAWSPPPPAGAASTRRRVVAAVCFVVSAWIAFSVYTQMAAGYAADSRVQQLREQNTTLQHEIDGRQRAIDSAAGDVWLAEEARKRGYVLPGERVYVPVAPGPSLPPDGGVDSSALAPLGPLSTPTPAPARPPSPAVAPPAAATSAPAAPRPSPTPYVIVVSPGH